MKTFFALFIASSTMALAGEPLPAPGQQSLGQSQSTASQPPETVVRESKDQTENDAVGAYNQPRWTDRRRFPGVRLYVAPPGAATFEYWIDGKVTSDNGAVRLRSMYEMSFGLGNRLQLDLYVRTESKGTDAMRIESERIELRYALADWGKLWGNPTVYLEFIRQTQGPNKAEVKLLFGGEVHPKLFWGVNLFFESELWSQEAVHEYGVVGGLAWSLIDSKLSLGAETRIEVVDNAASGRAPLEIEWLVGPSLSFRPVHQAHVLFTAYMGPGFERASSSDAFSTAFVFQPMCVAGWRF